MLRIVLIGTGNVATQLAQAIVRHGDQLQLVQLYGRNRQHVQQLSQLVGDIPFTAQKDKVVQADLYLCSVKDDAIADALQGINFHSGTLAHTAGSVPMHVLTGMAAHIGVFYPLQTFSREKKVDFSKITAYIEANSEYSKLSLTLFANILCQNTRYVTSATRARLHLAAVFACNFANHLYAQADDLLKEANIPFSDLLPLIDETVEKVHHLSPREAQTGPARRKDKNIVTSQKGSLNGRQREIYDLLSQSIWDYYD